MVRMHSVVLLGLFVLSSPALGSTQTPLGSSEPFLLGWKVGQVEMHEAKILDAFLTLELLAGEPGEIVTRVVEMKKREINTDLLALSKYLVEIEDAREVTGGWPEELRIISKIKSPGVKAAMARLRQARIEGNWEDSDTEDEEAIGTVLDTYVTFGNLLRIR